MPNTREKTPEEIVSEVIEQLRVKQLSQEKFAALCGCSAATISRYVNHKRVPGPVVCEMLQKGLDAVYGLDTPAASNRLDQIDERIDKVQDDSRKGFARVYDRLRDLSDNFDDRIAQKFIHEKQSLSEDVRYMIRTEFLEPIREMSIWDFLKLRRLAKKRELK